MKANWAHKNLSTQEELFERLLDLALKSEKILEPKPEKVAQSVKSLWTSKGRSRHIPSAIRRYVLKRDGECCVKCGSRYALQIDHIQPYRDQGTHEPENLQVLCRSCNLRKEVRRGDSQSFLGAEIQC